MRRPGILGGWISSLTGASARTRSTDPGQAKRALRLESLETRVMLAGDPINVRFNIPPDVLSQGVYATFSAQLTAPYETKANVTLPTGTYVYFNEALADYDVVAPGKQFYVHLTTDGQIVELPDTYVKGGELDIGVGSPPAVIVTAAGLSTPTPATSPTQIFGLVEYSLDAGGLDVDMSEIDQVGFPFTITTDPAAAAPAEDGVGLDLDRGQFFDRYSPYIASQGSTAAPFEQLLTDNFPYRILAPQDALSDQDQPTLNPATYSMNGVLMNNTNYYYWVTATNDYGETAPSNLQRAYTHNDSKHGTSLPFRTVGLNWTPVESATGYKVYRSLGSDVSSAQFLMSSSTTSIVDDGRTPLTGGPPPTNNYTFNPLASYFNPALDSFFDYYKTHEFVIDKDGNTFSGYAHDNYLYEGRHYTVLALTAASGPLASSPFLIFKPYFQENTNLPGAPPAPSWMIDAAESPGQMIFGASGSFADGVEQYPSDSVRAGVQKDIENEIDSAFNRGIAANFAIAPNNWASAPSLNSASSAVDGSSTLAPGTYYYVITANNADGETTTSLERRVVVASGHAADLEWTTASGDTGYNIYRSTTSGSGYQFLTTVAGSAYSDDGANAPTSQTPPVFYASGAIANWYAGFLHTNITNNPTAGVSINGLAYGFPYDDQGGSSTNFQGTFDIVNINIMPWGHSPVAPTTPENLVYLNQPANGRVGSTETVRFQVLGGDGQPYVGGTVVVGHLRGAEFGSYTIMTDAATGIGEVEFTNSFPGISFLELQLEDGEAFDSDPFVVSSSNPSSGVFRCARRNGLSMRSMAVDHALGMLGF